MSNLKKGKRMVVVGVGLIILGVVGMVVLKFYGGRAAERLVKFRFPGKIVYEVSGEIEVLEKDCKRRGGKFERCGDPCEVGSSYCVEVCVPTCEF